MAQEDAIAPVYRYFTADILTNEVLAEIPFGSVSYERAIKGAGNFAGSIPAIEETENLSLYENTMPGRTALYVVRNDICVWGGIIWSRQYDVVNRVLQVSASEFTSYFYHRRIWKTFNHEYGATVTVADGQAEVVFDDGSSSSLVGGSVVKLAFDYQKAEEWKYDGYYTIDTEPAPTTDTFNIRGAHSLANITSVTRTNNLVTIETENPHGFHTNDVIEIYIPDLPELDGKYTINVIGSVTAQKNNEGPKTFTFPSTGADIARTEVVGGEATRELLDGTYYNVTVSVRADTYDYIRNMIDAVFKDFVGIDFPNVYIEPGITYEYDIIERELGDGLATIKTADAHNAVVGQAIQIANLGAEFDGEFEIVATPFDDVLVYKKSGDVPQESVAPSISKVNKISIVDGRVTVWTTTPHEFEVGQKFVLETGIDANNVTDLLNGVYTVDSIINSFRFTYVVDQTTNFDETPLDDSIITLNGRTEYTNLMTNPSGEGVLSGTSVLRTNLCTHPNFEFSAFTSTWSVNGLGTGGGYSQSTTVFHQGKASARVVSNAGSVLSGDMRVGSATRLPFGLVAGSTYTFSAFINTPSVHTTFDTSATSRQRRILVFYSTNGSTFTESFGAQAANTIGWQRISHTFTLPSNTTGVVLAIGCAGSATDANFITFIDSVLLEKTSELKDFFDGNSTDALGYDYAWSGGVNVSNSVARGTATTVRTNLLPNPSFEVNTTGWTIYSSATLTRSTAQSYSGSASGQLVFASGLSGVITDIAVPASTTYTFSAWVRYPVGAAGVIELEERTASTLVTRVTESFTGTGDWQRFQLTIPFGSTGVIARCVITGSGSVTAHFDAAQLEASPTASEYFDGSLAASRDFFYTWSGTAHNSTSLQQAITPASVPQFGGRFTIQSGEWASSGSKSLRIIPTNTAQDSGNGAIIYPATSLVSGKTYTVKAKLRLTAPQTGTLDSRARSIFVGAASATFQSEQAPNTAGVHDVSLTFEYGGAGDIRLANGAPAGGGDVWWDDIIILEGTYTGSFFDGDTLDSAETEYVWDGKTGLSTSRTVSTGLMNKNLATNPSGETAGAISTSRTNHDTNPSMETASGNTVLWTNKVINPTCESITSGSAVIRRNLILNPAVNVNTTGYSFSTGGGGAATAARVAVSQGPFGSSSFVYQYSVTTGTTSPIGGISYTLSTAGSAILDQPYTFSVYVRCSVAQTIELSLGFYTSGPVLATGGPVTKLQPNTWTRLTVTGYNEYAGDKILMSIFPSFTQGTNWSAGDTLEVTGLMLEASDTLREYFNGTTSAGRGYTYSWTGTANASISRQVGSLASFAERTNLVVNPTSYTNVTGYTAVAGTGGTAAVARSTAAGVVGSSVAPYGIAYARTTWTVASTAIGTGGMYFTVNGLSAGKTYSANLYTRVNRANQRVVMSVVFYNASNAVVGTFTGTQTVLTFDAWTFLSIENMLAPAATSYARINVLGVTGTSGRVWAINDRIDFSSVFMEESQTIQPYFDGMFGSVGDEFYAFTGTEHASTSVFTYRHANDMSPSAFAVDSLSDSIGGPAGTSVNILPIGTGGNTGSYVNLHVGSTVGANLLASPAVVTVGRTYTVKLKMTLNVAQVGTLDAWARSIVAFNATTSTGVVVATAPNQVGTHELEGTFTVPSGSTNFELRVYNGGLVGDSNVWIEDIIVVEGVMRDDYFSGETTASGDFTYAWTGTAYGSTSTKSALAVSGWSGTGDLKAYRASTESYEGSYALSGYIDGTLAAAQNVSRNVGTILANSLVHTISVWVLGEAGKTIRLRADERTTGLVVVTTANTGYVQMTGEWQRLSVTFTASASASSNNLLVYLEKQDSDTASHQFYADALLVEQSTVLGTYFDGNSADTISDFDYSWVGAANSSKSTLTVTGVNGYTTKNPNCIIVQSTDWDLDGEKSIRIIPTVQGSNDTAMAAPYAAIDPTVGYVTVLGTSRLREPQIGTLHADARKIVAIVNAPSLVGGTATYKSSAAPNEEGEYSNSLLVPIPTDLASAQFYFYNGASEGGGDVWWDNIAIVTGNYDGEYFDGSIDSDSGYVYAWLGTADDSASTRRIGSTVTSRVLTTNKATLETEDPHNFIVGDFITVQNITPRYSIAQKSLNINETFNGAKGIATIRTTEPHELQVSDVVKISGLQDSSDLSRVEITGTGSAKTVTLTTTVAHNFVKGQKITVEATDNYIINQKSLASNVATLRTSVNHNIPVGSTVTVKNIVDSNQISTARLTNNVATLTLTSTHNYKVNDKITVRNIQDSAKVGVKEISNGIVTLTLVEVHNFPVGDAITVKGVGAPFDGEVKITSVTDRQVSYSIDSKYADEARKKLSDAKANYLVWRQTNNNATDPKQETNIAGLQASYDALLATYARTFPTAVTTGFIYSKTSVFNGDYEISDKTASTLSYRYTTDKNNVASKTVNNAVYIVTGREATTTNCILVSAEAANNLSIGRRFTVSGLGSRYDGTHTVLSISSGDNKITYRKTGVEDKSSYQEQTGKIGIAPTTSGSSPFNGTYTVTNTPTRNTFSYVKVGSNVSATDIFVSPAVGVADAKVSLNSVHNGERTLTAANRNSVSFTQTLTNTVASKTISGKLSIPSIFNGTRTILATTNDTFKFLLPNQKGNIEETTTNSYGEVLAQNIFNGTSLKITDITETSVSYTVAHINMRQKYVYGLGTASVFPVALVSTFGPYPKNADIGIKYSTAGYSGKNVTPTLYRGFQIANVGDALSKYSDNVDGFEYRIDCGFDIESNQFTRTFVMIPIDFPDPPAPGEISPISRFGADKLVFEYPGNIINLRLDESAERSSTRFFAIGENDLGPDAGPPYGVASAVDLLDGETGRRWPLLDDDEQVKDVEDELALYSYAERYLTEGRPPVANINVTVNGSLKPVVGEYNPGDWCSLVVDDWFVRQRLISDIEPRDTVIVRKIDSIKVQVPDGTTFPEQVELVLVAEWRVDRRG